MPKETGMQSLSLPLDMDRSGTVPANSLPKGTQDSDHRNWCLKQVEYLSGQFKNDGTYDYKMYSAAMTELFMLYTREIVFKATKPGVGLSGKYTFFPSIAEIRAFLDELAQPTYAQRSAALQAQYD